MMRYLFPLFLGVTGVAILVSLGLWQLDRLAWKEALLAEIEGRIAADPVALPKAPDPESDAYLSVEMTGQIAGPPQPIFGTWRGAGAGYRVIAPFDTDDRRVLLDLGVAAEGEAILPDTPLVVTGNLNWPDEAEPNPDAAIWTNVDITALARAFSTEPVLVVARAIDGAAPPTQLVPVGTEGIPNSHLGYAVQWFGLAMVWAGMTAFLLWRMHSQTGKREA